MESNLTNEQNDELEKMEIADFLFDFPFNTGLAGYSMLNEAILLTLKSNAARLNMGRDIYKQIASRRNINGNSVEKGIKGVIDSVANSSILAKEIIYPNLNVKNALIDGKPKHFIMAAAEVVKIKILRQKSSKK